MMRRSLMRVAVVATGAVLFCGGSTLRAVEAAPAASLSPFAAVEATPIAASPAAVASAVRSTAGATVDATVNAAVDSALGVTLASTAGPGHFVASIGVETTDPLAATSADGVAAIPLPPSAYPGMVGLATAALSVWRYRRRRR